ncbi:hypothetical protein RHSIM_Rhsim10G0179800 [Rhododendron simsii]|uniref:Uncharacterized protein n=1 Tax=Rhododendron simsii TaxID=118357 RepID=A0A834LDF9_RHOSS|nr:hypothetical protein RHSIM_Rhsim10G0179800 [Rhododendron simsii]
MRKIHSSLCIFYSFISFRLHERRQSGACRKLGIKLNHGGRGFLLVRSSTQAMVSPVSTLDEFARGSPRTPRSLVDEEERAIAEKGFFSASDSAQHAARWVETGAVAVIIPLIFQLLF